MSKTKISHVVINVNNAQKSQNFYQKLCSFMGLKLIRSSKSGFAYANREFSIWVHETASKRKRIRSENGYDHIAFSASSKKEVDQLQKLLKSEGFKILYNAKSHPEFAPGYYSVSFFDPDGTIMEFLYLPKGKNSYG